MTNLRALVSSYQHRAEQSAQIDTDAGQRKERWLAELAKLNDFVRNTLIGVGVPEGNIQSLDVAIQEDRLGRYQASGLVVGIGDAEVRFTPVGSMLIGACGRVDVSSSSGRGITVKLVADASPQDGPWSWAAYTERGRLGGTSLDEDGLAKVLETVLGHR